MMPYRILLHPGAHELVSIGGGIFAVVSATAFQEKALAIAAGVGAILVGLLPIVKRFIAELGGARREERIKDREADRVQDKKDRDQYIVDMAELMAELKASRAENAALMEQLIHSTKGVRNDQVVATRVAEANQKLLTAAVVKSAEAAANSRVAVETINAAHGSSSSFSLPAVSESPPETERFPGA